MGFSMKKSNIVLIGTFLIISSMSCLFGMKRVAGGPADGAPAASAQKVNDPVGLINNGSDCFINSAIQILYNIPEFRDFLNLHRTDYVLEGDNGTFSIPWQFMQIFEALQRSGVAVGRVVVNPKKFREFVCKNSTNSALRGMLTGQHDSGEFLKLLLEHFQYYTKYHLDLINMLAPLLPSDNRAVCDLLKKEFIDIVLCDISDFNNTDRLSFDFFIRCITRRMNEIKLKISKAKLKDAFQLRKLDDFARFALSTKELIQQLDQQESEEFFGKISDLINSLGAFYVEAAGTQSVNDAFGLFCSASDPDEIKIDIVKSVFGESKDWEWLKAKVGYLNLKPSDTIFLNNSEALNQTLDVISEGIRSPKLRLVVETALLNIQRNLLDFRRLFCASVNGNWQVCLNLGLPLDNETLLGSLIKLNQRSNPVCDVQDLLNSQIFTQANLPEILIVQPQSFSHGDFTLPGVGGFKKLTSEACKLVRDQKFPLTYQPSGTSVPLLIRQQGYKLIGMIYHSGPSASKGHFIAACKYDDVWKIFDDNSVMKFDVGYINGRKFSTHVAIYRKEPVVPSSASAQVVAAAGDPVK